MEQVPDIRSNSALDSTPPPSTSPAARGAPSPSPASERRDIQYRFKPGNQAGLKHGLYAKQPEAVLSSELQADLDTFEQGVVTDFGGIESLTTIEQGYVDKLRTVEATCQLALLNITKNGFTARSEQMLLQAIDRWDRIASRLGLSRRARPVPTLAEVMRDGD